MANEQFLEGPLALSTSNEEGTKPTEKCSKFMPDPTDANPTGSFDCNICLDTVQDPVVTMCGHLYCWPCIYKWLDLQKIPTEEDQDGKQPQCPVCKAEVSESTVVPLYGRGLNKKASKKDRRLVLMIPKRPLAPGNGLETPRTPRTPGTTNMTPRVGQQLHYQENNFGSSPTYRTPYASLPSPSMLSPGAQLVNLMDPMMGVLGEAVNERGIGGAFMNFYGYPNSYNVIGTTSPRIRRNIMQADRALARMCFFFFCCVLLCLMSF